VNGPNFRTKVLFMKRSAVASISAITKINPDDSGR
jgi:hypothetical protein